MRYLITILFGLIFIPNFSNAQNQSLYCKEVKTLSKLLDSVHYQPIQINEEISKSIFNRFISTLDPYGLLFTQQNIKELSGVYYANEQAFHQHACQLLNHAIPMYKKRLLHADSLIQSITAEPLDIYSTKPILFASRDTFSYSQDDKRLHERWEHWLAYSFLSHLYSAYLENDTTGQFTQDSIRQYEAAIRDQVRKEKKCKINHFLDHPMGVDEFVLSVWMNAITYFYDPHTMYFSDSEKQLFEQGISKEDYSFGIKLKQDKNGNIQISKLVPGGPAWKSGELNKGDILVKIQYEGEKATDLTCSNIYEVKELFRTEVDKTMILTVRKVNGKLKTVPLVKEKLLLEDNMITSFILEGEPKIGYISLPGFYTQVEQENMLGCANDMAKEIIKLKREHIDGLILDLRNNSGGSMFEAIQLTGIFIDQGPVCISKMQDGHMKLEKDMNRGSIYDKPLLVLVNRLSASASELLAATLQDYNRAVIVGTTTYGKGTAQIVLPVHPSMTDYRTLYYDKVEADGYIKLTISKFYRVTGKSHQKTGVIPDVILPDNMSYVAHHESNNPTALSADSINKETWYTPLPALPVQELRESSAKRVTRDTHFLQITRICDSISRIMDARHGIIPHLDSFKAEKFQKKHLIKILDEYNSRESSAYKVNNCAYDQPLIRMNPYREAMYKKLKKNIQQDIYIEEAYFILSDMIRALRAD
jgi:carboxyl-terminal processing protease